MKLQSERINMAYTEKFRYERKYLIDAGTACILKQRMSHIMFPDSNGDNGQYHISSLYFDDIYNTSFYEKQNGVSSRDKYRVRFYNNSPEILRLERKHKTGEMVYKESAAIEQEQFERMCAGDYTFMSKEAAPVFERFYATHVTRQLRPVIMVDYDRQAYMYPAGNVRITFDSGIKTSAPMSELSFSVIPEDQLILEIKYSRFIPEVITGLITGSQFTQQLALSKFVMSKIALQGVLSYDR